MKKNKKSISFRAKEEFNAMQLLKTTIMLLLLVFANLTAANAQQTIPAAGGRIFMKAYNNIKLI